MAKRLTSSVLTRRERKVPPLEDPLRAIRNLGCRPEEDLRANRDSDAGTADIGQKRTQERARCRKHFPNVRPEWRMKSSLLVVAIIGIGIGATRNFWPSSPTSGIP